MKHLRRPFWAFGPGLLLIFLLTRSAWAHDPGLSTATARLESTELSVTFALSLTEASALAPLDANQDGVISSQEFETTKAQLGVALADGFQVELDGRRVPGKPLKVWVEDGYDAYCTLTFPTGHFRQLNIRSQFLEALAPSHRQFFTLEFADGREHLEKLLSRDENSFVVAATAPGTTTVAPAPTAPANSFFGFLQLGVEHILTGYDHLLFLFALLVITNRIAPALQIITCFTIAHSITLAVATLNVVHVSSRIVEPLIAASIVYVAIENLVRGDHPKGRWLLTFAFGLIHGFGFASVLRELGVGANGSGIALPLCSFNLGVELGQLTVAAIALPIIWKLRAHPRFVQRWAPASSGFVALLGGFWFVQRVWFGG